MKCCALLCLSLKPLQSELMDWWVLLRLRSGYVVEVLCGLIITSLSLFEGRVGDGRQMVVLVWSKLQVPPYIITTFLFACLLPPSLMLL